MRERARSWWDRWDWAVYLGTAFVVLLLSAYAYKDQKRTDKQQKAAVTESSRTCNNSRTLSPLLLVLYTNVDVQPNIPGLQPTFDKKRAARYMKKIPKHCPGDKKKDTKTVKTTAANPGSQAKSPDKKKDTPVTKTTPEPATDGPTDTSSSTSAATTDPVTRIPKVHVEAELPPLGSVTVPEICVQLPDAC